MARIVISLLTYNSEKYLEHVLKSIARQTFHDFELVIRDNNSTDGSAAFASCIVPYARVIMQKTNDGFSRAHNATIRETSSEYVCILNPDIVLSEQYFGECVSFLDAHPSVGAVSGLLIRVKSLTETGKSDTIDSSGLRFSAFGRATNLFAGKPLSVVLGPLRVLGVSATAAVYRRSALEDVAVHSEYFDEDFFMYKEDIDLALRFALRGWEAYTLPSCRAWHVRSTAQKIFERPSVFINQLSYRNHWYVLIKSVPEKFFIQYGFLIAFFECCKFLYILFAEPRTLTVFADVLRNAKKMLEKRKIIMARKTVEL